MMFFRYLLIPKDKYKPDSEQKNLDKEKKLHILLDGINKTYGDALHILSDKNTKENIMCNECNCGTEDKLLTLLVNKRIKDKIENNELFSAWDITSYLRSEVGPSYDINHSTVRNIVTRWFENRANIDFPEYSRTTIYLKNGKVTNVYHPLTTPVEKYLGFASIFANTKIDSQTKSIKNIDLKEMDDEIEEVRETAAQIYVLADDMIDTLFGFLDGHYNLKELREVYEEMRKEFRSIDVSNIMPDYFDDTEED